jgi:hypothetical protein
VEWACNLSRRTDSCRWDGCCSTRT